MKCSWQGWNEDFIFVFCALCAATGAIPWSRFCAASNGESPRSRHLSVRFETRFPKRLKDNKKPRNFRFQLFIFISMDRFLFFFFLVFVVNWLLWLLSCLINAVRLLPSGILDDDCFDSSRFSFVLPSMISFWNCWIQTARWHLPIYLSQIMSPFGENWSAIWSNSTIAGYESFIK